MALPPSTANWHWKNKNVNRWAKEWFERELTAISITGDKEGEVVSVSSVTDVDGDVELGQRKSKFVILFTQASSQLMFGGQADYYLRLQDFAGLARHD
jgi:activator of HSP90 ATPase